MRIARSLCALLSVVGIAPIAAAHQAETGTVFGFSTNPATEGTPVALSASVRFTGSFGGGPPHSPLQQDGDPVVGDSVRLFALELDGEGVACGTPGADYVSLGTATTDASGVATLAAPFDTTGLAGHTVGFRAHHPTGGPAGPHRYGESMSECADLEIVAGGDPLPDALSFTQGYYGSSPLGESIVATLLDEAVCEDVAALLEALGVSDGTDCADALSRASLAYLLTGPVGPGPERPSGFLPSGFEPGDNATAQVVTLLLNLNLGLVLGDDELPLDAGFFLNVDPVQDLVDGLPAGWFDPLLTTGGALGSCSDDAPADDVCDAGSLALSALGEKAADLDAAGTSVGELLDAALDLLGSGLPSVALHGVELTPGDVATLVGLVNESFDEGQPTGFVTAFDAD